MKKVIKKLVKNGGGFTVHVPKHWFEDLSIEPKKGAEVELVNNGKCIKICKFMENKNNG